MTRKPVDLYLILSFAMLCRRQLGLCPWPECPTGNSRAFPGHASVKYLSLRTFDTIITLIFMYNVDHFRKPQL